MPSWALHGGGKPGSEASLNTAQLGSWLLILAGGCALPEGTHPQSAPSSLRSEILEFCLSRAWLTGIPCGPSCWVTFRKVKLFYVVQCLFVVFFFFVVFFNKENGAVLEGIRNESKLKTIWVGKTSPWKVNWWKVNQCLHKNKSLCLNKQRTFALCCAASEDLEWKGNLANL